ACTAPRAAGPGSPLRAGGARYPRRSCPAWRSGGWGPFPGASSPPPPGRPPAAAPPPTPPGPRRPPPRAPPPPPTPAARARRARVLLADQPLHLGVARLAQPRALQRRGAGEQLVEEHAQRIDVAARVAVQAAHLRLLGAHVRRRADHLPVGGEQGPLRQLLC